MENMLKGIKGRVYDTEEWISNLEDSVGKHPI